MPFRFRNMMPSLFVCLLAVVGVEWCSAAPPSDMSAGRDITVDPMTGDDTGDGTSDPVKSIRRAIALAQPGDTIHLAPGRYFESAIFSHKSGTAEQPITLDGHGAVIDGSDPIDPDQWIAVGHGLFRSTELLPDFNPSIVHRWYFLIDGRMVRMGRSSKGPKEPWKAPADLSPGEWTVVEAEQAFYLRIRPGQELSQASIRIPRRSNAVGLGGTGGHLVIRNIVGTHVYNDGFNVHGHQVNCRFENITAIECGDDGFSAHEDAECRIDGFVSIGNSTGLCDIGESVTHYRNVYIRDCHGFDIYLLGETDHSIENALVESSAATSLQVSHQSHDGDAGPVRVQLKNVLIRRQAGISAGRGFVSRNAELSLADCTLWGIDFIVSGGGAARALRSVFGGQPSARLEIRPEAIWTGAENSFDVASWSYHGRPITRETFGSFQQENKVERNSRWEPLDHLPPNVGAEITPLEALRPQGVP